MCSFMHSYVVYNKKCFSFLVFVCWVCGVVLFAFFFYRFPFVFLLIYLILFILVNR